MKNRIFKSIIALFSISLLSSCAMHQGYMVNSASLSSNNFTYVKKDIKGTAMATYVFGLGGLSKTEIVDAAKRDLIICESFKRQSNISKPYC